jgi:MFS family permease
MVMIHLPYIGRKFSMGILFLISALFLGLCIIPSLHTAVMIAFAFICRGSISTAYSIVYVYIPEIYPTNIRGIGLALGQLCARIGGILTPVVAVNLFELNSYASLITYVVIMILGGIISFVLPKDTQYLVLHETANDEKHHKEEEKLLLDNKIGAE